MIYIRKNKGYLACLLFVTFAIGTSLTNQCSAWQERWRLFLCHPKLKYKSIFFCCFHRTFYITLFIKANYLLLRTLPAPVFKNLPFFTVSLPFTITYSIPSGSCIGFS